MNDNSKLFVTMVLIKLWNTTNVISITEHDRNTAVVQCVYEPISIFSHL